MDQLAYSTTSVSLPGPLTPAWDQAKAWIERPIEFWSECHAAFGDTFVVDLGSIGKTVLFCDPQAARNVFALPADTYVCAPYNQHYQEIMGDLSLLALDGPLHREQRRIVGPQSLNERTDLIHAAADQGLRQHAVTWQVGQVVDLRLVIHEIAFNGMLGILCGPHQVELRRLLSNIFLKDLTKDYGSWSPWARFTKWHPLLRKTIAAEVQRERSLAASEPPTGSLFEILARHQDSQGNYISDPQIADHIFTMLIAGVDPSALATLWATYWIHQDPEIRQRLADEIAALPAASHHKPAADPEPSAAAETATFLDAVCRESLRMYPVVTTPTGRKLLKDVVIEGCHYPAGITLLPCTYLIHRRPDLYPDPDRFYPQRFLTRTYKTYEYFPFGGGHRTCTGARLGLSTMKIVLTTLLKYVRLELAADGPVGPARHGTLLAPSANLKFRVLQTFEM